MERREFFGVLAAPLVAEAQQVWDIHPNILDTIKQLSLLTSLANKKSPEENEEFYLAAFKDYCRKVGRSPKEDFLKVRVGSQIED